MSDKIDALYEAAQQADDHEWQAVEQTVPNAWGVYEWAVAIHDDVPPVCENAAEEHARYIALAHPQTVMALVELYRAAKCIEDHDHSTHAESRECAPSMHAAIEKVESLG